MTRRRCFQEGSLFKRGKRKKVWVGRWWEPVIVPDGQPGQVRRSEILGTVAELPTIRDARQVLYDRLRKVNSGDYRPQAALSLRRYVEDRWKPDLFPTLKYSTKKFYEYMTKTHLIPEFGDTQLRLITKDAVQRFLNAKARSGLSWKTVKHIRTVFRTIIEAAFRDDLLSDNPVHKTRLPRRGQVKEHAPIEAKEVMALLEALPEPSRSIGLLLVSTGMRIGEVLALRWRDVDFEATELRIRQTVYEGVIDEPKTKQSIRKISVGWRGIDALARRKPTVIDPNALVFATRKGTPLSRRNLLNRQFKPICEKLGLTGATWHWLRHVTASLSSSKRVPLGATQELLGHSSSQLTRDVYVQPIRSDVKKAVQMLEDLVTGPKWTQVPDWPEMGTSLIN
jgi:integrase